MKRIAIYILLLVLSQASLGLHAAELGEGNGMAAFCMQSKSSLTEIAIGQTFSKETTLEAFGGVSAVSGLSITMDVERLADDFLVRILLEDAEGHRHLVAESYREIATEDAPLLHFTNYCEETALLDGVVPSKLHVYANHAVVTLRSLQVSAASGALKAKARAARQQQVASLKRQQAQAKADQINAYNEAHNKLWRAGETGLCLLSHADKMSVMGMPENGSTHGLEYYKGGIFEFGEPPSPSQVKSSPAKAIASVNATVNHVAITEFDWRNRHGHNWMTAERNQGNTPYCVAFSVAGCMESMRNLYYYTPEDTTHLSVQQLACCSFDVTDPIGKELIQYTDAFSYS